MLVMGLHSVHIVVVIAVNASYVVAILRGLPPSSLAALQFTLAVYKVFWVNVVIPRMLLALPFLSKGKMQLHRSFMVLFSFIGAPLFSTFFSDSSCFLNVLVKSAPVSSSFQESNFFCETVCDSACAGLCCNITCGMDLVPASTVYTNVSPGWLYSYQCSSALLVDYVPVLVLSFLLTGLIIPGLHLLYLHIPAETVKKYIPRSLLTELVDDTINMCMFADDTALDTILLLLPQRATPILRSNASLSSTAAAWSASFCWT